MDPDTYEEDIKDVVLDGERERGVDGTKALLHDKKWDLYNLEKDALVKGGYLVEVADKDENKVIWEVVNDHVVEEGVEHEDLGMRDFNFNLFDEERVGCVGDYVKELPSLLMLMTLCPGDWDEQIDHINKKLDEENGRGWNQENRKFRKIWQFSRNIFWKNIRCLLSEPTFGLWGSRLWEKDPKISGMKRKKSSIRPKVDLYEVCESLFQIIYYCYYFYTNTSFPSAIFLSYLTLGAKEFRKYWPRGFESEGYKEEYELWRARLLIYGFNEAC